MLTIHIIDSKWKRLSLIPNNLKLIGYAIVEYDVTFSSKVHVELIIVNKDMISYMS